MPAIKSSFAPIKGPVSSALWKKCYSVVFSPFRVFHSIFAAAVHYRQKTTAQAKSHVYHLQSGPEKAIALPVDAQPLVIDPRDESASFPELSTDRLPQVSSRLLFQIQADEFGKDSQLEGLSVAEPLAYVRDYVREQCSKGFHLCDQQEELLHEMTVAHAITSSLCIRDEIIRAVGDSFATHKPFLIPGGWIGVPSGHAIYYEVIPNGDLATLRIFNTGKGIQEHPQFQSGVKEKIGFVEWRGISMAKLLDPHFAQSIEEMRTQAFLPNDRNKETEYGFFDIYYGLKEFLDVKEEKLLEERETLTSPLVQPQLAGTCSYRSLMAFVKSKMEKKEFRRFKCAISIQALISNLRTQGADVSKEHFRLVQKSVQQLGRKLDRMYRDRIVGKAFFEAAQRALAPACVWVEETYPVAFKAKPFRVESSYKKLENSVDLRVPVQPLACLQEGEMEGSAISHLMPTVRKFLLNNHVTFSQELNRARVLLQRAYDQGEYAAVNFTAIDFVKRLAVEEAFWEKIPGDDAQIERIMQDCDAISNLLFQSCYRMPHPARLFAEKTYALFKICHVQTVFAKRFQVQLVGQKKRDQEDFFQLQDGKMQEQWNLSTRFTLVDNSTIDDTFIRVTIGENFSKLALRIRKDYPEVIESVRSSNPTYDRMSTEEQNFCIYGSPNLPPWLKSLRDMELRYLDISELGIPDYVDERCSLEFNLVIIKSDDQNFCCVKKHLGLSSRPRQNQEETQRGVVKPPMREFLTRHASYLSEKNLLATRMKAIIPEFSEEASKELFHLFGSFHHAVEAVEYFTRYSERLGDLDCQQIFQLACFGGNQKRWADDFAPMIALFLKKRLEYFRSERDIQTCVFLLQMSRYFSHYQEFNGRLLDEKSFLQSLLQLAMQPEEKSVIYAEHAAYLGEHESLSGSELQELLVATVWISDVPVPPKWKDPKTEWEVEKALCVHSKAIEELVAPNRVPNIALLNAIYREVKEEAPPSSWRAIYRENQDPILVSERGDRYRPLKGRLVALHRQAYLPLEIRKSSVFHQLFPLQLKGEVLLNECYRFQDIYGHQVVIKKDVRELWIEQERADGWYRFIPKNSLGFALESRYLCDHFTHWISMQNPSKLILIKPGSDQEVYHVQIEEVRLHREVHFVTRLSDQVHLSKPSNLFTHIEDSSYIQEWYGEGDRLVEIALPRFNLSFKPVATRKLECLQYPGLFVAEDQTILALGACSYHLVLIDSEGKKRILLPDQELKEIKEKEVLAPRVQRDQKLEIGQIESFGHVLYEIDERGTVQAKSREDYFYLIEILAAHQEYELAAFYLRKCGEKLSAYSPKEQQYLKRICEISKKTGDSSGEQNAIGLYAAYLLATNESHSQDALKILSTLYLSYLIHFQNTTALRLTKEEELRLLKNLLAREFEAHFFERLRELDPVYAKKIKRNKEVPLNEELSVDVRTILRQMEIPSSRDPSLTPEREQQALLTRSSEMIKTYLFDYVKRAIQGTPEQKKWLRTASIYLRNQPDEETFALGIFFQNILENPERFTVPPKPLGHQADDVLRRWWYSTTGEIREQSHRTEAGQKEIPDLTSSTFHLDTTSIQFPSIPFSFTFTKIPSLSDCTGEKKWLTPVLLEKTGSGQDELRDWFRHQQAQVSAETDPLQSHEWSRLISDLEVFQSRPFSPIYRFNVSIGQIQQVLQEQSIVELRESQQLETRMLQLANKIPSGQLEQLRFGFRTLGKLQKKVTLNDILISFAQKNPKILQKLNQSLTQEELQTLFSLASDYLLHMSNKQQQERCLKLCQRLKVAPESEKQELENQLALELKAKRMYDPKENPAYLVFEYHADILMRPEQVEKLSAFLLGESANLVMEMIMGSGKSKVLLPLLGLLRADGRALPLLIVPAPLFESVASDTQTVLQESFAEKLRTLLFDRNTTFTKRSLEEIRDLLQEVIDQKECLIMTSKSIQSLLLKFVEYAHLTMQHGELNRDEKLLLMEEILILLSASGNLLIDEADTVLNVLHEVSFSLGQKTSPKTDEIQLVGEIFDVLYSDPELRKIARIESDPNPDPTAPPLTESLYHRALQRPLAKAFLNRLKAKGVLPSLKESDQNFLLAYLCRNPDHFAESQRFFDSLSPKLKNLLALAGEEFSHLLPHTLTRVSNENYGLDGDVLAIPYDRGRPSHGSLFANPYITMNYTFQTHFRAGISKEILARIVQKLKKQADQEVFDSDGSKSLSDTTAWKQFCWLKGDLELPLLSKLTESQLDVLERRVNQNPSFKISSVMEQVLPQLELFEKKLSCNPMGFTALFSRVSGFTGTLWNAGSLHRKLKPVPEVGTDARTLSLLWKMSQREESVQVIRAGSIDQMFLQVQNFDLIADGGGYFKEGGNLSVARKLAMQFHKPVVFYNSQGEQTVTDGVHEKPLSEAKLSEESRLTFLDQSHTTGADVKQRGQAIGLVSIGRNMLLRDLLQSVWRLRGLEKGQAVRFIIDQEVESIIRQKLRLDSQKKIGFAEILQFVVQNQTKQKGDDNFKAFKQQIWSFPQSLLFESLCDPEISEEEKKKIFEFLRETWIKPATISALTLYGSPAMERPSREVLQEEGEKCKKFLDRFRKKFPKFAAKIEQSKSTIEHLMTETEKKIHPFVSSSVAVDIETVEVEQETKVETTVEVEVETEVEDQQEYIYLRRFSGPLVQVADLSPALICMYEKIPLFPIAKQMKRETLLREYAPLFEDILISANVLEWQIGSLSDFQLFGPHRTPFHHLFVEGDTVSLVTNIEASSRNDPNYYNLYLGYKDPTRQPTEKAFEKIVKLKFLNGESIYNKKEQEFLKRWIRKAGVEKMQRLFIKIILKNQPDKGALFVGSILQKVFSDLLSSTVVVSNEVRTSTILFILKYFASYFLSIFSFLTAVFRKQSHLSREADFIV